MVNTIFETSINYFNLLRFSIVIEDRRPELSIDDAYIKLGYKYKILIECKIFNKTFSYVGHALRPGSFFLNDKECDF